MFKTLGDVSPPRWIGNTLSVCVYTHTHSVGDSLRRRDVTQWFKMRQYPDLTVFWNFGKAIKAVLTATKICVHRNTLTSFFISIVSCQWKREREHEELRKLYGLLMWWQSPVKFPSHNKYRSFGQAQKQRKHTTVYVGQMDRSRDLSNILVSAMAVNDEVIKAEVQEEIGSTTEVSILSSWQEEADWRLVSHID